MVVIFTHVMITTMVRKARRRGCNRCPCGLRPTGNRNYERIAILGFMDWLHGEWDTIPSVPDRTLMQIALAEVFGGR